MSNYFDYLFFLFLTTEVYAKSASFSKFLYTIQYNVIETNNKVRYYDKIKYCMK